MGGQLDKCSSPSKLCVAPHTKPGTQQVKAKSSSATPEKTADGVAPKELRKNSKEKVPAEAKAKAAGGRRRSAPSVMFSDEIITVDEATPTADEKKKKSISAAKYDSNTGNASLRKSKSADDSVIGSAPVEAGAKPSEATKRRPSKLVSAKIADAAPAEMPTPSTSAGTSPNTSDGSRSLSPMGGSGKGSKEKGSKESRKGSKQSRVSSKESTVSASSLTIPELAQQLKICLEQEFPTQDAEIDYEAFQHCIFVNFGAKYEPVGKRLFGIMDGDGGGTISRKELHLLDQVGKPAAAAKPAEPTSSGDAPVHMYQVFLLGDSVSVWSQSKNGWIEDGVVIQVDENGVHVQYDSGTKKKLMDPEEAQESLKSQMKPKELPPPEPEEALAEFKAELQSVPTMKRAYDKFTKANHMMVTEQLFVALVTDEMGRDAAFGKAAWSALDSKGEGKLKGAVWRGNFQASGSGAVQASRVQKQRTVSKQ